MAENTPDTASSAPAAAPSMLPEDFSLLKDVPLTLQVHLGDATLTISDIMKCGKGSVIPLNQKIGDPFVIMLQHKAIAEGEVVEAGGQLGIKITNVFRH